jgi:hypothetical protein
MRAEHANAPAVVGLRGRALFGAARRAGIPRARVAANDRGPPGHAKRNMAVLPVTGVTLSSRPPCTPVEAGSVLSTAGLGAVERCAGHSRRRRRA